VIVRRVHGGPFAPLVAEGGGVLLLLPHHVAPPVLDEVHEHHGRHLDGEEQCPRPRAPAGPLLVRVQADVDVGDADDADAEAQEPVRQVPRAPRPHPPVRPEEADEWLEPDEAVQRQPDPLVRVVEGVLEVAYRQHRAGGGESDGDDLRGLHCV